MIKLICKQCGKEFFIKPYRATIAKYCSLKCRVISNIGKKRSGEIRKKISNSHLGIRPIKETKRKMSDYWKNYYANGGVSPALGSYRSEEQRKRLSDYWKSYYANGGIHPMQGKHHSEKSKIKNSNSHKGRKSYIMTDAIREKLKKNNKTKLLWENSEYKKMMSESHKGYIMSEEHKKNMSKASKGKPKSETHKKNIGNAIRGKKHWNWKNGITPLVKQIRNSFEYYQWHFDVFTRDNFTCQKCGLHSGLGKTVYLEAHHKKEFNKIIEENNITTIEQALNCKELWNIDNGITLCRKCHGKTKNGRKKSLLNIIIN